MAQASTNLQVEKWLGLSSLSGLYQAAESRSARQEVHTPGLGLGASPSVKQQVSTPLSAALAIKFHHHLLYLPVHQLFA